MVAFKMIALYSGALATSYTTEAPLAPEVPRLLGKGGPPPAYTRVGGDDVKCCINGNVPAHNWIDGVCTESDCRARCDKKAFCTGFTFSWRGCLLWKEALSPTETIHAKGYRGCWHKQNSCPNNLPYGRPCTSNCDCKKNCTNKTCC